MIISFCFVIDWLLCIFMELSKAVWIEFSASSNVYKKLIVISNNQAEICFLWLFSLSTNSILIASEVPSS